MDYLLQLPHQLAPQLKSLRKAAGMSQARLAHLLGISQARVAVIERDPLAVSVGQLAEILRLLDLQLVLRANDVPGSGREAWELPPGWQRRKPQGRW